MAMDLEIARILKKKGPASIVIKKVIWLETAPNLVNQESQELMVVEAEVIDLP
jgi:hypothetical protein